MCFRNVKYVFFKIYNFFIYDFYDFIFKEKKSVFVDRDS